MTTEATTGVIMEGGGATTSKMKVRVTTKSNLRVIFNFMVIDKILYFMMGRKLLHRLKEVCGANSRMMKDELIIMWTVPDFIDTLI